MPVPNVEASAQNIARLLTSAGVDLSQIPTASNGQHTRASLNALLVDGINAAIEARRPNTSIPTMTPEEAWRSGRLANKSLPNWEARYQADPVAVGRTLASLYPILAQNPGGGSASPGIPAGLSAAEQLDVIDDQIYGEGHSEASRKRLRTREDEEALTQYQEILAAETAAAGNRISTEEYRAIFGEDPSDD